MARRRLHHPARGEPCHLESDRRRRLGDLAVETAHDATETDRTVVAVADQQIGTIEGPFDAVEGDEGLAVSGEPDAKGSPSETIQVVGVIRLTEFEHDHVRYVDHVVDRPHPSRCETAADPGGALSHGHAREHCRREPAAAIRSEDLDGHRTLSALASCLGRCLAQCDAPTGAEIAGDTEMTPAVGTVARHVEIKQHIGIETEHLGVRPPGCGIGVEQQDS